MSNKSPTTASGRRRPWRWLLLLLMIASIPSPWIASRGAAPLGAEAVEDTKSQAETSTASERLAEANDPNFLRETRELLTAPPDNAYADLVVSALRVGQWDAARLLLDRWPAGESRLEQGRLSAVLRYANGQWELCLRSLDALPSDLPSETSEVASLLRKLARMGQVGLEPGCETNPWGVRFTGPTGEYVPGLQPANLDRIPPEDFRALRNLLTLLPQNPQLWILLGDLYNAIGDPAGALTCFRRAMALGYRPRALRERERVLEAHVAAAKAEAMMAIETPASNPSAEPSNPKSEPPGWGLLQSRSQVIFGAAIGLGLLLFLVILQIREWLRRR